MVALKMVSDPLRVTGFGKLSPERCVVIELFCEIPEGVAGGAKSY
jgi:hypothetical protein